MSRTSIALRRQIEQFARDERGVISAETVILTPLLVWVFLALFVYWDGFRAQTTTIKASYTIADLISRENAPINNAYIQGMHQVYRYMVATSEPTWMRVTSVRYTESNNRYTVLWSRTTNASRAPVQTTTTMNTLRHRLPVPADNDALLVVETWRNFTPAFQVGLSEGIFYELVTIRSRFLSPLPIS